MQKTFVIVRAVLGTVLTNLLRRPPGRTVPENPAPTITKVFCILWKFYQANMARRLCAAGILRLTFGRIRGQIA